MKLFSILAIAVLCFAACNKNSNNGCSPVSPESESASIAGFCATTGILPTIDTNGIYYQIIDPGSGARPNENSTVTVTYTTSLLSEQIIDTSHATTPITLPLNQFIEGWRLAIPYIQEGGHMKMVIPSYYAYGCVGVPPIVPPNSPLYFDVFLKDVTP